MPESEEMMIVSAERCLSNSDRVTNMLKDTSPFSGIPELVDHSQPPCSSSTQPLSVEIDASVWSPPKLRFSKSQGLLKCTESEELPHSEWGIIS